MVDAQRIGDRKLPGAGAKRAKGLEPDAPGFRADGLDEVGAFLGACSGRRIGPRFDGLGCRRAWHRNDFAARLEIGDGDGALEDVGRGCLVELIDRRHAGLAVLDDAYSDADVAFGDVLVDAIVGEAR